MNRIPIKALFLDYGGVVSRPQDAEVVNAMVAALGVAPEDFKAVYPKARDRYDSGHITAAEYWQRVLRELAVDPGRVDVQTLIHQDVESWTRINASMIEFIRDKYPDSLPKFRAELGGAKGKI